jgi:hypothetical protein
MPPFTEPLWRTLARNLAIAAAVGGAFALVRHDFKLLLPLAALALWFSLGGHCVEIAFLNGLRPRLPPGRLAQALARLLFWFGGGVLLYAAMAATARLLPVASPPLQPWWLGGLLFIGIELIAHAALALRGLPNFYNGRG